MNGDAERPAFTLVLVRHAQTELNAQRRFRGHIDVDLDSSGLAQAAQLAAYLPRVATIEHVYAGPLRRTTQTAIPIAEEFNAAFYEEPRLIDLDFGEWAGQPVDEIAEKYAEAYELFVQGNTSFEIPGGELIDSAAARFEEFLREALAYHAGETVAFVTHDIICQLGTCMLLHRPLSGFQKVKHDTAAFSLFAFDSDRPRALYLNQHAGAEVATQR
jgi:broad specificity phosphatase PhoE